MSEAEHARLVRLIRQVAKEVAFEVLDEHLASCEHEKGKLGLMRQTRHG
jgi:hypothetical protein